MFRNHFKVALRNLLRQKFFSFINVFGLAVGIACGLLIFVYVSEELSYDNYHPDKDQIYRIALDRKFPDNSFVYARTPMPMGPTVVNDIPNVESFARIYAAFNQLTFEKEDKVFEESRVFAVDSTFFNFFEVKMVEGDRSSALDMPNSLVITTEMAIKYFGNTNAVGEQLTIQNVGEMMVRAVVEPMPTNSHFHFDFLFSLNTMPNLYRNDFWGSYNTHTYIKLIAGADTQEIESDLRVITKTYMSPQVQNILGIDWGQYEDAGNDHRYFLQPLESIHLESNFQWEIEPNGNKTIVYLFLSISVFILLIACVNFINLTTARAANRAREVGMRKVLGAVKEQLIRQFLVESILTCFISTLIASALAYLMLPYFNDLSGKSFELTQIISLEMAIGLTGFSIILGLVAGLYPAFILSSFKPITVLKGSFSSGAKRSLLRNVLVVIQFSISVILVIGTLVVHQQIKFLNDKPLGFDKDQLLIVERSNLLGQESEAFKNSLRNNPQVLSVSGATTFPGRQVNGGTYTDVQGDASERYLIPSIRGNYNLIETMGLDIVNGRAFNEKILTDTAAIVINEAAVKTFGWSNPIGKQLQPINGPIYNVVGVVKDFHFESMHTEIGPVALIASNRRSNFPLTVIKLSKEDISASLNSISTVWEEFNQEWPLEYTFVNESFGSLYEGEQKSGKLFSTFAVLAILIASLGAFGLAAFLATQRQKEIGIRKVLGASITSLMALLNIEFVRLIVIANVIAWPVSYYLMQQWLKNFAYAVGINFQSFAIASIVSLLIALITVSFHSFKVALRNPSDTLHTE